MLIPVECGVSVTHVLACAKLARKVDMDLKIAGKTALVTGASAGIGYGIAKALAAEGVRRRDRSASR